MLFEPRTSKVLDYPNTFDTTKSSLVQYKDAQSSFDWPFGRNKGNLLTPPKVDDLLLGATLNISQKIKSLPGTP